MSSRATRLTSVTGALLALLASLILVAWIAPAVQAHSQLVSSDPEDGAELSRAPEEITLTFAFAEEVAQPAAPAAPAASATGQETSGGNPPQAINA